MVDTQNGPYPNIRLTSTSWEHRLVKIVRPTDKVIAQPPGGRHSKKARSRRLSDPLGVTLKYQGGATASIVVEARGMRRRFDGDTGIYDVLAWFCNRQYG